MTEDVFVIVGGCINLDLRCMDQDQIFLSAVILKNCTNESLFSSLIYKMSFKFKNIFPTEPSETVRQERSRLSRNSYLEDDTQKRV